MFYGKVQGTEACNLAALRGLSCGNEIFQKIFREEFAGFWIKEIGSIVARNESLKAVADKIGIRMVMECAMELQDGQLLPFLMKKARNIDFFIKTCIFPIAKLHITAIIKVLQNYGTART